MWIQPKPYMEHLRLRNHAKGVERRRNLSKIILEHGTPFPKSVTYADIDKTVYDWVDKKLEIIYNGKPLPTYKLFSNQKLSEYSQTWSNLDEAGSLVLNFKTLTRESNPLHGESQGSNYNIPGNRDYPMFFVPVLQENGEEAYDMYTMKQPLSVNFMYNVSIICNKYELLNKFNELMQYEFSGLECYIFPNDHAMPMVIENINDESEYSIDDRKYYAQNYQIKLMGYVVREEDFKVTKIPSRFFVRINAEHSRKRPPYRRKVKDDCWLGKLNNNVATFISHEDNIKMMEDEMMKKTQLDYLPPQMDACDTSIGVEMENPKRPSMRIEDIPECCEPRDPNPYVNKALKLIIDFPYCEERSIEFSADTVMDIEEIETTNVHDFVIRIDGKVADLDNEIRLEVGTLIKVDMTREDEYGDSKIVIIGTDPFTVIDTRVNSESELDTPPKEEDIIVKDNIIKEEQPTE